MTKRISEVATVDDLRDGEQALADRDVTWRLRSIQHGPLDVIVTSVHRTGDVLIANGDDGLAYPVSGDGAYVMTPRAK